jgi:glycosyltransferase involved in cell wall biosynthesis
MHKNHGRLIEALDKVKKACPDISLVLVGSQDKNGYKEVRMLVNRLDLQENVIFMGYVPDGDMPEFYRRARALVMPTFFGPTNIPPLEAFSLGCPVAISGIYGMPEQVGDAAMLFDPESVEDIAGCMNRLWTDDELRERLVVKGKERVANWEQRHFNRRFNEIMDRVTGSLNPKPTA